MWELQGITNIRTNWVKVFLFCLILTILVLELSSN